MNNAIGQIQHKAAPILKKNDVAFAGVFGSFARGEEHKKSDIDMLITFGKPKDLFDLIGLEMSLSKILGHKVDLVTEAALHPYIRDNVFSDLKVIYGKR